MPLIAIVIAALLLSLHTGAAVSCEPVKEGTVAEAEKRFTEIRDEDPSACGGEMAARRCAAAKTAAKQHLYAQALKGYQRMLVDSPTNRCANDGMVYLVRCMCRRAAELEVHGATEAASKAYAAILAVEPLKTITSCPAAGLLSEKPDETEPPPPVVIQGEKGERGEKGARGARGRKGERGPKGADGTTAPEPTRTPLPETL
ncbi:collagen-like protein [Solirubrobacter phytolaccae]|uniref:Collagen-like protein n=1 Tax=Solirubrobacter phytolaccae TaxID=1404360 RepID=A0A9X3NCW0_9ACTN|nr:hypothetical protein [Solirubrobacter phytolaccae]MDA0181676.1 collagen-like protein [Solirubrobacter phytolaccae]